MKLIFDDRLQKLRLEMGLNMKQAADGLGMKYTTYIGYEKNEREPNSEVLIQLADFFHCSADYLLGRTKTDEQKNITVIKTIELSKKEKEHIQKYRKLDDDGKEFVDIVIDHELKRCTTLQEQALDESEKKLIEKYRSSDDNTKKIITSIPDMSEEIEVYRAAMSDDDHEDEIIKMSRAEIEKLLSLPDTDEDL